MQTGQTGVSTTKPPAFGYQQAGTNAYFKFTVVNGTDWRVSFANERFFIYMDLDRDGVLASGDLTILKSMVSEIEINNIRSRAQELVILS
ncbi:MAG: hypothetical protein R6V10_05820 [bacterium]